MRVLYVAAKYDYGDQSRGLSFEHHNFYDTLIHMGFDILYFDYITEYQQRGKSAMNTYLLDIVKTEKPNLLFCVLFKNELDIATMRYISNNTDTTTFNWFCDDHWRFDNYSRHWAPAFNWVSTTAVSALPKYQQIGYKNVIKTQWACNHYSYKPSGQYPEYDVTFVGQPHGNRRQIIDALRASGIRVETWGHGWPLGRLSQEDMITVFSNSRINLNLSNASIQGRRKWQLWHRKPAVSQIKGRNFEVPGCGGFMLTDLAENLEDYYTPGQEIAIFPHKEELVSQVKYYLDQESVRRQIAENGYRRTLAEHTYEKRFEELFQIMGLTAPTRLVGFK